MIKSVPLTIKLQNTSNFEWKEMSAGQNLWMVTSHLDVVPYVNGRLSSFLIFWFNYFHHFRGDPFLKIKTSRGRARCWEWEWRILVEKSLLSVQLTRGIPILFESWFWICVRRSIACIVVSNVINHSVPINCERHFTALFSVCFWIFGTHTHRGQEDEASCPYFVSIEREKGL